MRGFRCRFFLGTLIGNLWGSPSSRSVPVGAPIHRHFAPILCHFKLNHMPSEAIEYTFPTFYNLPAMAESPNVVYVNSNPSVINDDPSYINTSWNRVNRKTTILVGNHQWGSKRTLSLFQYANNSSRKGAECWSYNAKEKMQGIQHPTLASLQDKKTGKPHSQYPGSMHTLTTMALVIL